MQRIEAVSLKQATGRASELLTGVKAKLGMAPNLMKTMAQSPAALQAYLQFNDTLATGDLSPKQRELIAVTVGQANGCHYCLSAHTAIGKSVGLSEQEILDARQGGAVDSQSDALIGFVRSIVENRGQVSDDQLTKIRVAGYSDGEIAEIVGHVALNTYTNYFNLVAGTEIDFPLAPEIQTADNSCSQNESCAA